MGEVKMTTSSLLPRTLLHKLLPICLVFQWGDLILEKKSGCLTWREKWGNASKGKIELFVRSPRPSGAPVPACVMGDVQYRPSCSVDLLALERQRSPNRWQSHILGRKRI